MAYCGGIREMDEFYDEVVKAGFNEGKERYYQSIDNIFVYGPYPIPSIEKIRKYMITHNSNFLDDKAKEYIKHKWLGLN